MDIINAIVSATKQVRDWVDENKVQKVSGKGLSTNDYTALDKSKVSNIPNDLVVLDGKLYLAQDGAPLTDSAVTLPSGGGGSETNDAITLKNLLSNNILTVAVGQEAQVKFSFLSNETSADGMCYVYVNDMLKTSVSIICGDNAIDMSPYITEGVNSVRLSCMDIYSNSKNLAYSIEVVSLNLLSSFDATLPYNSDINYVYTPVASATKVVHVIVDNVEIGTEEVTTSGRQQTYVIPKQPHGSHTLEVYFTVELNNIEVQSNHLYYDLICIDNSGTTPIISCSYNNNKITQFDTIVIPYVVYSPTSLTSHITLSVNGSVIGQLEVDRTKQNWSFRADEYGELILTISCGTTSKALQLNVQQSSVDAEATTSDLELYLSSYGRNNNETNPAIWSYGDISSSFSNFNFVSDGWQLDDDGVSVLRVAGDAILEIPYEIFANDFRSTGKTIEIEFAAKEVLDYEATIISCMSGGRGIQLTAQRADLFSEQSTIGTQYKENEHVRISFVVEKKSENRFLLIYINGILSGAEVYPEDDDFTQPTNPTGIIIGSNYCTTDVYCIRVYNNSLTRHQILDNWIVDTQNGSMMLDRYSRNKVYDAYGDITIDNLPADLPYLVIESSALPQYKGDKKTCSGRYVDVMDSSKSFTFSNAQCDVQGTSSQYYYVKNYKIKFKNGFVDENGVEYDNYQLNDNAVPTNTFTFKADVASSEGANNVVLAQLYNDLCPVLTPPQQEDSRIRQTIDGHPIVVFWDDGTNVTFLGKYNFNNDKGTSEVFGFSEGDESWEIRQNGTDLVGWKSDDFSGDWSNDFEARYPEDNTDITNLQALSTWLVSTNTEAATNEELPSAVTYDGVEYTIDSAEYRLAKFIAELPDHADVDALVFYYLITEIFLCIDQREKNAFPTLFLKDGKWIIFFYDADSSLGIDNKGKLAFDPYLEDIDYTAGGDPVYNGQGSVLFVNLRKGFYSRIMEMYQQFRVDGLISYDIVNGRFEKHQNKWCEAIFNEDMYRKCLFPMINDKDSQYLPMLLGKKEMQRKWWLYNRFRFLDSKYITGSSMDTRIMIRAKSKGNVWLTPYINMYGHVYYNDEMVEHRMERGKSYEYVWSASGAEDAVIGINDADMLTSIGDLSVLQVETIDVSLAKHLTILKIGDASQNYENKNLTSVTFGNNTLLRLIDLRNCSALDASIDIVGCTNVEEVYCDGTSITGINLPVGGILKTLHLPNTITNLTIRNQPSLTDFVLNDSSNLTTLRLENVGALIDAPSVINAMADGSRIRIIDADWYVESEDELTTLYNKLIKMRGLDENGNNTNNAVLTGRIRVGETVSDSLVNNFYIHFGELVIDDGSGTPYIINFLDRNGNSLYVTRVAEGSNVTDPIEAGLIERPADIITDGYTYEFVGWSILPQNVTQHYKITPVYKIKYTINYYNGDDLIYQYGAYQGESAIDPVATGVISTPIKDGTSDTSYKFAGWDNLETNIQSAVNIYAKYDTYWIARFWNDNVLYLTEWVIDGGTVIAPKDYFEDYIDPTRDSTAQYDYQFSKWDGDFESAITEPRDFYAVYTSTTRRYNVYFYNGDELIQTVEGVLYGYSTSYTGSDPVKTGVEDPTEYVFKGWMPAPENITGETKCYALYKFTGYLFGKLGKTDGEDHGYGTVDDPNWDAINTYWTTIENDVANYKSGTMNEDDFKTKYQIGGRMIVPIEIPNDNISTFADVEIIAYSHDDLADGSGKATLTFLCKDVPNFVKQMNSTTSYMGWVDTDLREFLNETLLNVIPESLKTVIKPVLKISDGGYSNKSLVTSEDLCWIPSYEEVGFTINNNVCAGQGYIYDSVFSDDSSRIKYIVNSTDVGKWWLRSTNYNTNGTQMFLRVQMGGAPYAESATNRFNVAFGFCI